MNGNCPRCHTPLFELPGGIRYCMLTRVNGHQQVTLCDTIGEMREAGGLVPISASKETWAAVLEALELGEGEPHTNIDDADDLRDALTGWLRDPEEN